MYCMFSHDPCLQISLRPAQSFLMNKNQVPKLQPQIPTMIPPSAQPPRTQTPPLGQVENSLSFAELFSWGYYCRSINLDFME